MLSGWSDITDITVMYRFRNYHLVQVHTSGEHQNLCDVSRFWKKRIMKNVEFFIWSVVI